MAIPTLSSPPTPPSRSDDSDTFADRADAFVQWWAGLPTEINAISAAISNEVVAAGYNSTSSTSVTIGTGSKSFTIETGKLYAIGQYLIVSSTAGVANYMVGQVTAYNSGTGALALNVTATGGSGTFASWVLGMTAVPTAAPFSYATLSADATGTAAAFESTGLSFAGSVFAINSYYEFEARIQVKVASGNFNVGLAWPAGVTGGVLIVPPSAQPVSGDQSATASTANVNSSSYVTFIIKGFFYTGGSAPTGNLQVQYKNASGSAIHTISKGSFLRYRLAA